MNKTPSHSLIVFLVAAFVICSGTAFAKNDKNRGHKHSKESSSGTQASLKIGARDRDAIKVYLKKNHYKKCPPGLAKKNNRCLPPGIAKKYSIGKPLPGAVNFSSLPADLLKLLNPAPYGHKYVQVDKDILLINRATQGVIDAVTLLSAVGN